MVKLSNFGYYWGLHGLSCFDILGQHLIGPPDNRLPSSSLHNRNELEGPGMVLFQRTYWGGKVSLGQLQLLPLFPSHFDRSWPIPDLFPAARIHHDASDKAWQTWSQLETVSGNGSICIYVLSLYINTSTTGPWPSWPWCELPNFPIPSAKPKQVSNMQLGVRSWVVAGCWDGLPGCTSSPWIAHSGSIYAPAILLSRFSWRHVHLLEDKWRYSSTIAI